jgi:hypothetical protein
MALVRAFQDALSQRAVSTTATVSLPSENTTVVLHFMCITFELNSNDLR